MIIGGIILTNLSEKNKCNIHFRKGVKLADTINLVDTTGRCPTVNDDGTVNITNAESENSLLCMAPDAYGTSYYYRGNVQNNYVKFANFYWRIVRINGDGSVRIIYDGTVAHANGEESTDRTIGNSKYNYSDIDNAYAGYNIALEENPALKKYKDVEYSNLGYGKSSTLYEWIDNDKKPDLACQSKNDAFTVSDTTNGNGALKYPIALLSIDEYICANGNRSSNPNLFLNIGNWYWIFSVFYFDGYGIRLQRVGPMGYLSLGDYASHNDGVKPVINLRPDSLTSGDGTINNPYVVE